jgi:hypothetical protein
MRRIGALLPTMSDNTDYQAWVGAFQQGMAQSGWIIGRNAGIDTHWRGVKADDTRRSWSPSRPTSSSRMAARQWGNCCG